MRWFPNIVGLARVDPDYQVGEGDYQKFHHWDHILLRLAEPGEEIKAIEFNKEGVVLHIRSKDEAQTQTNPEP